MRILVYGMQSSGASLVTFFLGQAPKAFVVVDLWSWELLPALDVPSGDPVIAKCVITCLHDFEDHARRFRPDKTILVLRDPVQNYRSLSKKHYENESGPIDEKFRKLQDVFEQRDRFDLTIVYEDFVQRPKHIIRQLNEAGIPAEPRYYSFPRSKEEIRAFNGERSDWCREHYNEKWGFGNVQGRELRIEALYKDVPPQVEDHVRQLCPAVCAYYDDYRVSVLERYRNTLWRDWLSRRAAALYGNVRRRLRTDSGV